MTEEEALIRGAITTPSGPHLDRAITTLRHLAQRAYHDGDRGAYEALQPALFDLHLRPEPGTHWVRQFLASQVYDIEAERMLVDTDTDRDAGLLERDELRHRIWGQQRELTPLCHPLLQRLFTVADRGQVEAYLRQQWLILQFFWTQFVELGAQLERNGTPIRHLVPVFENVWDELGEGDPSASHVERHRSRQHALGLAVDHHATPDHAETMDYINTRLRLMRAENPAQALGSIFSQEATAQSYGRLHHDMLERVGIGENHGQLYALHSVADVQHADEVLNLGCELATSRLDQERFLVGHRAQMLIWWAHFDRVEATMGAGIGSAERPRSVPSLSSDDRQAVVETVADPSATIDQ